jgi:hypothetical protein
LLQVKMVDLSKMPKRAREQWAAQQLGKPPSEAVQRRWQEQQALAQLRQQRQDAAGTPDDGPAPEGLAPEEHEAQGPGPGDVQSPGGEEEEEGEWQEGGFGMVLDLATLQMMRQREWRWLGGATPAWRS